jgi:hypothetical protein
MRKENACSIPSTGPAPREEADGMVGWARTACRGSRGRDGSTQVRLWQPKRPACLG